MKNSLAVLIMAAVLLSIGATNAPVGPITFGTPEANTGSTNAVHVMANTSTESPSSNLTLLIAVGVPALLAGLKSWIPKTPSWVFPILAPALGALADYVMQLSGVSTNGVAVGALLGSAGVGIRELQDQLKQLKTPTPATPAPPQPPVATPPPTP